MRTTLLIPLCLGYLFKIFGCHGLVPIGDAQSSSARSFDDALAQGLAHLLTRSQGGITSEQMEELLSKIPDDSRTPMKLWVEQGIALMGGGVQGSVPHHTDSGDQRPGDSAHGSSDNGNCGGCHNSSAPSEPKESAAAHAADDASSCKSSCRARSDDSHCKNDSGCGMSAYFEDSYESVILFSFWKTLGAKTYFPSLLLIFVLSVLTVFLKVGRRRLTNVFLKGDRRSQAWKHAVLALLAFVVTFMDFCMMLIVMTFNVGIVLVVCAGYAVGYVLTCYTSVLLDGVQDDESPIECDADCC